MPTTTTCAKSALNGPASHLRASRTAQFRHCGAQRYYIRRVSGARPWPTVTEILHRRRDTDRSGTPLPSCLVPHCGQGHLSQAVGMRTHHRATIAAVGAVLLVASGYLSPATSLPAPPRVVLSAADEALLAQERGTWESPTGGAPKVARDFQPPAEKWLSGHRGVDLSVHLDGKVRAPEAGTVSHVGKVVDRNTITIDHGNGLRSSFEPVDSNLKRGDRVRKGQIIGTLSNGNHCALDLHACVHWGVRLGDEYVNPLQFVGAFLPSVLLPVPD